MLSNPTFVFGDRDARPPKDNRTVEHILGDIFTTQGFVAIGISLQALCALLLPRPYAFLPGLVFVAVVCAPNVLAWLGLSPEDKDAAPILGKTSAYLDFAHPAHAGKHPGYPAFSSPSERWRATGTPGGSGTGSGAPPKLALMLIGSQCRSSLAAAQPEFKQMGQVFASMIEELRAAPPHEDLGFLNAEFYMHSGRSANNGNMVVIYWRSYEHMLRFAHKDDGKHWPAWNKYRTLQREKQKLGTEIGIWHEVYEISNAEAVYHNMQRIGLGDMWDAVPTPSGKVVYRNSLVAATGDFASSNGRLGYDAKHGLEDTKKRNDSSNNDDNDDGGKYTREFEANLKIRS